MNDRQTIEAFDQTCRDFRLCFNTPAGQNVMIFLADFCRAAETCVAIPGKGQPIDLNRTLLLEGRREVFLEIQKRLNLTPEHLFLLATGRPYQIGETTDE